MIGTRNSDQTRSHAQKYFKRIEKIKKNPDNLPFISEDGKIIEEMLDKHTRRIIGQDLPEQFAEQEKMKKSVVIKMPKIKKRKVKQIFKVVFGRHNTTENAPLNTFEDGEVLFTTTN